MPACGSWPAAVPLAAYSGGVVRSAAGDFTSSPTDDPGAPAAWLPESGTYLLALFSCLSFRLTETRHLWCASVNGKSRSLSAIASRMLHNGDRQQECL